METTKKNRFSDEINNMSAIDLWNQGTIELASGCLPDPESFCGQCWLRLKNDNIPGERIVDWTKFEEDIEELLSALDYYKIDKSQEDYMFLQNKLIEVKLKNKGLIKENRTYNDLELSALYLVPNENRLEIPQNFHIGNFKDLKQMMKNFDGKYSKNGFDFKYPAVQILERISNQETDNLKKKYQFFGTPKALSDKLCEMTFDPMLNRSVNVLEPSAGQGAILKSILNWFDKKAINIKLNYLCAIEYMKENHDILNQESNQNYDLHHMDFLEYDEFINYFDYVIANPPFTKGQDIEHFYKMYEVCKPGGIVTSIMSTSWIYNNTKKYSDFRKWLGIIDENERDTLMRKQAAKGHCDYNWTRQGDQGNTETVYIKTFEAGAFKESGTNVITCVLQIRKNNLSGFKNGQTTLF